MAYSFNFAKTEVKNFRVVSIGNKLREEESLDDERDIELPQSLLSQMLIPFLREEKRVIEASDHSIECNAKSIYDHSINFHNIKGLLFFGTLTNVKYKKKRYKEIKGAFKFQEHVSIMNEDFTTSRGVSLDNLSYGVLFLDNKVMYFQGKKYKERGCLLNLNKP